MLLRFVQKSLKGFRFNFAGLELLYIEQSATGAEHPTNPEKRCIFQFHGSSLRVASPMNQVLGSTRSVFCFAKSFAGTEFLILIGVIMTFFPMFFAIIENDLRRVLTYCLNSQLGFMIVAIGIGTELAINGAVAHAFAHIIYKGLLFMSMGAVLYRFGTCKAS